MQKIFSKEPVFHTTILRIIYFALIKFKILRHHDEYHQRQTARKPDLLATVQNSERYFILGCKMLPDRSIYPNRYE